MTSRRLHPAARCAPGVLLALVAAGGAGCYGTFLVAQENERDAGNKVDARVDEDAQVDASVPAVEFANVWCDPPVEFGLSVIEEQGVECGFTVRGTEGTLVTLSCENENGLPVACGGDEGQGWPPRLLEPTDTTTVPVHGFFQMLPYDLAGERATTVWVATPDEGEPARYTLSFDVVEEPLVDPPEIYLDCGGGLASEYQVGIPAGGLLPCNVVVHHPAEFAPVSWTVTWPAHPPLDSPPEPMGGQGVGVFPWSWQTTASESGRLVRFVFVARLQMGAYDTAELWVDIF